MDTTKRDPSGQFNTNIIKESIKDFTEVPANFDTLIDLGEIFVFTHIISPHSPYVFGANGEKLSLRLGEKKNDDKHLYLDQHIFITNKVRELVEHKLSSSQVEPVIIIQADHGAKMDKSQAHKVFSAVFIPANRTFWPDSISSFNTDFHSTHKRH